MKIRTMRLSDHGAVRALWRRSEGVGLGKSDTRSRMAFYLKRNPGMSFVAVCGDEVVGVVLCGHEGRRGYLHHLAVDGKHRRQGLGTALVSHCLKELRRCGILKCNIFLFADNRPGMRFWRAIGWNPNRYLLVLQRPTGPSPASGRRSSR